MTYKEMSEIIQSITYKPGWDIVFGEDKGGRPYVQISVGVESEASLSPFTGEREAWKSGKNYLSPYMCRQEIVGAVFGVIRSAEEHEMREWFKYKKASIFNPHLDPDTLAIFARQKKNINLRVNAMSMEE